MDTTICAVATPRGRGGISVIRVSGPEAVKITKKIFRSKNDIEKSSGNTVLYGFVYDGEEKVDECLVSLFKNPNSYTGEDVCEISCHGGVVVTEKIISLLTDSGCVMARPGEFTKRAFINGKMSLTAAEAVKDIIDAKTQKAAFAAVNRLSGKLSEKISFVREKIVKLIASVQVSTDFPDEETDAFSGGKLDEILFDIKKELFDILKSAKRGIYVASGAVCAIAGVPNTGKSSLLNALSGEEKAIVTDIEGTTRDAVESSCDIGGVMVKFVDTAGIRDTEDKIEKIGVKKSKKIIEESDFVIFLTESGRELTDDEKGILRDISSKEHILVLNKCDKIPEEREKYISISAKTGLGMDKLRKKISSLLDEGNTDSAMIANERQREAVAAAMNAIDRAIKTLSLGIYSDLAVIDITEAAEYLGEADGMSINDEVVDRIFKEFCLGK